MNKADQPSAIEAAIGGSCPHCVVCGEDSGEIICQRGGYNLLQCKCGGIYLSPCVAEGAVDQTVDIHPSSFYSLPAAMKVRWLAKTKNKGTLLEVGCGDGYFLRAARDYGFRVAGIELDAARATRLAQNLHIDVECGAIEHSKWPGQTCDVVYHCDLLSHFPDPALALQKMTRLLLPDGVLFFEVGIVGDLRPIWYRSIPESDIPRHRWFFLKRALHRLLANVGLTIERIKTFSLYAPDFGLSRFS